MRSRRSRRAGARRSRLSRESVRGGVACAPHGTPHSRTERVFRQVWDVYGMFFCSVPQQGTRREHTQNSTSCGHFRFPHVSGVWVGVGVGHEHKATVHEAFLHGNPGYQPITNRSRSGNNRSCSRLHHIYKHYPCTSSCMQGAPTALTMH